MFKGLQSTCSRLALTAGVGVVAVAAMPSHAGAQTTCVPLLGVVNCTSTGVLPPALPSTPQPVQVTVQSAIDLTGSLVVTTLGPVTLNVDAAIATVADGASALAVTSNGPIDATVQGLSTTGASAPAALLRSTDNVSLLAPGTISTTGALSDGVNIEAVGIAVDVGTVRTLGVDADGVELVSVDGPIVLNADVIETSGDLADGAILRAAGDITLDVGLLRTDGNQALGLNLQTDPAACVALGAGSCAINGTIGSLTTNGNGSIGALVNAAGPTTLSIAALQTNGTGAAGLDLTTDPTVCAVLGAGACDTTVSVGQLRTIGDGSAGLLLNAPAALTATVGAVSTNGDNAPAITLITDPAACLILGVGGCSATANAGSVATEGDGAAGIGVIAAGPVRIAADQVTTNGLSSPGITVATDPEACAILGAGACATSIGAGTVSTGGDGSAGIGVTGALPVAISTDRVTTLGNDAPGISVATAPAACVIVGVGTCGTGINAGTVTTGGDRAPGIAVLAAAPTRIAVDSVSTGGITSPAISVIADPAACAILGVGACATGIAANSVTTGGANSSGIGVSGAGPIAVAAGEVSTAGGNAPAIVLTSDPAACAILGSGNCGTGVNAGTITTSGDGSTGLGILASGPVSVVTGPVTTAGSSAPGIAIVTDPTACIVAGAASCTTNVTSGSVVTGGDGSTGVGVVGSGPITVATGPVRTAGENAPGISVAADPAACLVIGSARCTTNVSAGPITTGGNNSPGIGVVVGGPTTISAGPITTGGNSPGISVSIDPVLCATLGAASCPTTINTGPITSGGDGVYVGGGGAGSAGPNTGSVTIGAGPVTSGDAGIDVNVGCQNVDITARGPIAATNVGISARSQCGVRIATLPGAPVYGGTTGVDVSSGTGASVTIGDRLSSGSGVAFNADGGAVTLTNQASGTIVGRIDLTNNADVFNNAGRFAASGDSSFGGGADLLVNSGTIAIRPGATAAGSVTFAGLEATTNSGSIDLRNGQVGDQLVLPGSYVGSGAASLGVDLGANGSVDRLVVGTAATGNTTVLVNGLNGTLLNNAVIVDAGAGTTGAAFALPGGVQRVGLVDYTIEYNAAANDFALFGIPTQTATAPIVIGDGLRQSFYRANDAVASHLEATPLGRAFWGVSYGSVDTRHQSYDAAPFGVARRYSLSAKQDWFGLQLGADLASNDAGMVAGVTAGYATSNLNMLASSDRSSIETANIGAYARLVYGPLRFDGLAKYEHAWTRFHSLALGVGDRTSGDGYGGRVAVSVAMNAGPITVQPFASVDYATLRLDRLSYGGFDAALDASDGIRGKAGARVDAVLSAGPSIVRAYASGALVHEFEGRDRLTLSNAGQSVRFSAPAINTYGQARLGIDVAQGSRVRGFIEGTADIGSGYNGGGARGGLAVRF